MSHIHQFSHGLGRDLPLIVSSPRHHRVNAGLFRRGELVCSCIPHTGAREVSALCCASPDPRR
jgi:hypothetical protein